MSTTDHRLAAKDRILALIDSVKGQPAGGAAAQLVTECEALARAIGAFHMEGIRFRMFNVDRLLSRPETALPPETMALFAAARVELEAAGFHTRSHQAPG